MEPQLVLYHGKVTTLDPASPEVTAVAVTDGRITATGSDDDVLALAGAGTQKIDLGGRRVIPGLNDSHLHVIRAGLFYNLELRWDGVPSVAQALEQLRIQAERTPPPQWVRVIGGWNEFQFAEGRMPTLEEINEAAPDTPVFVLHLYDSALLNRAALRALGFGPDTPNPPGGLIARDGRGNPTGLLIAEPSALILYSTIANAPTLSPDDQLNSTRHYLRELNRFGVTSVSDAGGGGQNYPDDYAVVKRLADEGHLTVRIAYSLFAQKSGAELADYRRWLGMTHPGDGDDLLRVNGAGENLVWSAADFENFLQPRPDLRPVMEAELEAVVRTLAEARWPWRIHATYDESIGRFLDIFERVHRDAPIDKLRWFIDHAETVSERNLDRIQALGGGVAIQHRMAYQGEYYIRRYGIESAKRRPPLRRMLEMGLPVGAGTDGTRVASYHPWTCLWWMVTSKTVGGTVLHAEADRLTREEALRLYTHGSAWFSGEDDRKGRLTPGSYADMAVLSGDYFTVAEDEIRAIESLLTIVGGRVVYGASEYASLAPATPPVSPDWSPVAKFGGYDNTKPTPPAHQHLPVMAADGRVWETGCGCGV
ncbi:amidohydrolase [Botrimarina mediterranea]|uniref:N-substituted formamide deformylase n=1 Tax=Botrimarina mediterranea TaxID=2528022 RepID=A0A518K6Q7_9BACT|nr:amidohydrolase [Botrimarina mediterranea]QDV73483.1 N-substituted formamide deformylase precursor [Botrimarina mediterranea]QDV78000.1 N-substituted formamide deformylase precursor [Planctomycetes bacterium K2D]